MTRRFPAQIPHGPVLGGGNGIAVARADAQHGRPVLGAPSITQPPTAAQPPAETRKQLSLPRALAGRVVFRDGGTAREAGPGRPGPGPQPQLRRRLCVRGPRRARALRVVVARVSDQDRINPDGVAQPAVARAPVDGVLVADALAGREALDYLVAHLTAWGVSDAQVGSSSETLGIVRTLESRKAFEMARRGN